VAVSWLRPGCALAAPWLRPGCALAAPWLRPVPTYPKCIFGLLCHILFVYHALVHEKGKPVVRRGRKATGLY
jgi:hypothetical protein